MLNELDQITIQWLGLMDYEVALEAQIRAAERVRAGSVPCVMALHHHAVVTLGKRGQALSDLLVSLETMREKNIRIVATDRGGQATFHNPGQLVLYPILPLAQWGFGVRDYVECLERATAYFCAEFGIEVTRGYEPGLWVDGKKTAAFGIRIDRGVSMHGVSINLFNDLEYFSLIRQCGQSVTATNLSQEMSKFMPEIPAWDMTACANLWLDHFKAQVKALIDNKNLPEYEVQTTVPEVVNQFSQAMKEALQAEALFEDTPSLVELENVIEKTPEIES
ncbi:MAG: lipoyl(octanoyl) transferase LipB [Oligoflexia bacterium]|nr:lipoyl(octanoyl) transferase LipB [Oligoflexia bacterium]